MHHTRGGASGPLERFDIASELDGVPPKHNPYGYVWTAPRHSLITHASFRARNGKPDVIDLYPEAPLVRQSEGRVLRFKVPFVHTTSGTFFRPAAPLATKKNATQKNTIPQQKAFAPRGDRTHDPAVKSRALCLLS